MSVLAPGAPQTGTPGPVNSFLNKARRRLRVSWAIATSSLYGPYVMATAVALALTGRLQTWRWPEPTALAIVLFTVLSLLVRASTMRLAPLLVARAADRGLDAGDVLSTAVEFGDGEGPLIAEVNDRAGSLASQSDASDAIPYHPQSSRLALASVLGVALVALVVANNPQDAIRIRQAEARSALSSEADLLADQAETLLGDSELAGQGAEAGNVLLALAEQLRKTDDLDRGAQLLKQASQSLREGVDSNLLAQKAAAIGLDRSLANQPLAGSDGGSAAEQLNAAAAGLPDVGREEKASLISRLSALAKTQEAGNPGAADALHDAAQALVSGDEAASSAALEQGAVAQQSSSDQIDLQEAAQRAATAAAEAGERVEDLAAQPDADPTAGSSEDSSEDIGDDAGLTADAVDPEAADQRPAGEAGVVTGQSTQPDSSSGAASDGTGTGVGGESSDGSRTNAAGAGPSTDASSTATDDTPSSDEESTATRADTPRAGDGEQVVVRPESASAADGQIIGETNRPTADGSAWMPLAEALKIYEARASRTLDQTPIPPSQRSLVRAYFDQLAVE